MEPMLEVFIYESTSLLEQLDEILLDAEKSKSFSEDNINEIFRTMHTIKGSSAMMEFTGISTLAHAVEDVFFILREDPSRMGNVNEALFDLVFQASDFLKTEIESVQNSGEANKDPSAMIAELKRLAAIMKGEAPAGGAPAPAAAAESAAPLPANSDPEMVRIRVHFEDGCQMENIRAFMLISQLKELCDKLESIPANPESDSSCCSEIIKNGLLLCLKPAGSLDDVIQSIENAVNIKTYEVIEDTPQSAPAQEAQAAPAGSGEPSPAKPAAAPASPAASAPAATGTGKVKQSLVSVNQSKLDQLMDLVGEIVTSESMVVGNPELRGLKLDNFHKSARELRKLTDELQDVVMSIRMVPLSGVFQRMNRIVRDMCKKLDKDVDLITEGGDTEVDKTINEAIGDPFMHMIRNSMDHGIELPEERLQKGKPAKGRITLAAKNIGGEIVITISDDGQGLDTDVLMKKARANGLLTKPESEYTDKEIFGFIMLPGFSTNKEVTEFSGRGVGMDVVRQNLEKVGGTLSIDSKRGEGTTFTIKIPLTLAIVDGMELAVGSSVFTLPITSIKQSFKLSDGGQLVTDTDGSEMIMLRGQCYPLIRLHQIFGIDTQVTELTDGIIMQIENSEKVACIFADELLGEQQVVVKPFPKFLSKYEIKQMGISGCTILGDGSISLILDANNLLNSYR
ncbi:MAG: chemotaxis protein CheA [Angelakisella sp.]|nr:chemotaxis protein CheA [Angelakisella sp.]